jgi:hypothetical protein
MDACVAVGTISEASSTGLSCATDAKPGVQRQNSPLKMLATSWSTSNVAEQQQKLRLTCRWDPAMAKWYPISALVGLALGACTSAPPPTESSPPEPAIATPKIAPADWVPAPRVSNIRVDVVATQKIAPADWVPAPRVSNIRVDVVATQNVHIIPKRHVTGCGSRGGPGYRTKSGRCASWHDSRRRL